MSEPASEFVVAFIRATGSRRIRVNREVWSNLRFEAFLRSGIVADLTSDGPAICGGAVITPREGRTCATC